MLAKINICVIPMYLKFSLIFFFFFLIMWISAKGFESEYSETMNICPLEYGAFVSEPMLYSAVKTIKTSNTPRSPKPAFVQVLSTEEKQNLLSH